jgi:putative ABC transport system permease protein
MFFQNLKVGLRISARKPVYTLINVFGISMGLAVCLLIGLYIQNEWSYDRYHRNSERIFRVATKGPDDNGIAKLWGPAGPAAAAQIPEIENSCRFGLAGQMLFDVHGKKIYEQNGIFSDPSVFDVFSWQLLEGNKETALKEPNTLVLTKTTAEKYFGHSNPVGESIIIDNNSPYRVTGVMEDVPGNSHFRFDFLLSMASYPNKDTASWVKPQFFTYLLLKEKISPALVAGKIDQLLFKHLDSSQAATITSFLQPITTIHLHSNLLREMEPNSDVSYIYIAAILGLFVLIIACLNFINLSTVQAMRRSNETAIRKTVGASRSSLIKLYLSETLLICFASALLAIGIALSALPYLNTFLEKHLVFDFFANPSLYIGLPVLILLVSFLSGLYPAFILSSFKPVSMLGKRSISKGHGGFRNALVISQFSISVILIIAAMTAGRQLQFIRKKNLGFNKEQLITIPFHDQQTGEHIQAIKDQLLQVPGVQLASVSANQPGGSDYGIPYNIPGLPKNRQPEMRCLVVDEDFINTYRMQMIMGRNFQAGRASDSSAYLINEEAARELGLKDPVGQLMEMPAIGRGPGQIIGVVKDFHFHSLHEKIAPLYFFMQKGWYNAVAVRIKPTAIDQTLAGLKSRWAGVEPSYPFSFSFFDQTFSRMYTAETRLATLIRIFSFLAVFIACLGLFGLAAYTITQRTKEIGIRKIVGATSFGIVALLSKKFLKLVLISSVIAFPVAWFAMHKWLEDFAYRINIGWWVFVAAAMLALFIAFITVSFLAIRAAISNPVKSLRTE